MRTKIKIYKKKDNTTLFLKEEIKKKRRKETIIDDKPSIICRHVPYQEKNRHSVTFKDTMEDKVWPSVGTMHTLFIVFLKSKIVF
jgi:hypothetical protein